MPPHTQEDGYLKTNKKQKTTTADKDVKKGKLCTSGGRWYSCRGNSTAVPQKIKTGPPNDPAVLLLL